MNIIEDLKKIIPDASRVIPEDKIEGKFLSDSLQRRRGRADALVFIVSTEETSRIMAYADKNNISITARGTGMNLTGSTVPLSGGIVLDVSRLNHLLEIDPETFTATVEAGMVLEDFQKAVEAEGLFYPPDPGEKTATIGGTIATNAGGMRAVKYGVTRDYVRGLEIVKADGAILRLGTKNVKDSSGLSLKNLIIGSEGTLAVITKAIIRLVPLPKYTVALVAAFESLDQGIRAVRNILMAGTEPVAVEFIEKTVAELGERYTGLSWPVQTGEAYIIMSYDGQFWESIDASIALARSVLKESGSIASVLLDDKKSFTDLWKIRGCLVNAVEAVSEQEPIDIVVPINKINEFIECVHAAESESGIKMVAFGHAGDGNVHLCVLRESRPEDEWEEGLHRVLTKLYRTITGMGGLVSGEHGIGIAKQPYFIENTAPENLLLMNQIKKLFDPHNILNPGKVFQIL
ncbi:glycolate oxidase [Spirochaetia bacterium]|nr:glycolate oxidase [Spirochaetia bacterium]GHU37036.1 glycolate oxidase [Spirochaetia bacterium]